MDAATTIRLFEYGVKLSLVGVFNSIFLFPVYKFAGDQVTMATDDPVKELSLSNMKQGNLGTIAMGIRALSDPLEYYFGRELGAKTILLMMVLYVYSCMAPITSYFTLLQCGTES